MIKEWMTPAEIAAAKLPTMPTSKSSIISIAKKQGWATRKNLKGEPLARRNSSKGGGLVYHYSLLPDFVQPFVVQAIAPKQVAKKKSKKKNHVEAWRFYEGLPDARKAKAKNKLRIMTIIRTLHLQNGMLKDDAVSHIASCEGVSARTIYSWFDAVAGVDHCDWLPFLVDRRGGTRAQVECDPTAWQALKVDYLRAEKPSFTSSYRRTKEVCEKQGWKIPSERTLYRRLLAEVPKPVIILRRDGMEALKHSYPPQRRDRSMFRAMEAINADGHIWDVNVKFPDGVEDRPVMVAIQDLYSNKILGWRIDRTENTDLVRLAFGDVFAKWGIPKHAWLDNGRAFASKYITGRQTSRFRFKIKQEEPSGILTSLNIKVHWTLPYSGQSKPIERAFRDLCDTIAKHPMFHGAYTGNSPHNKPANYGKRVVDFNDFVHIVHQGILRYNAQPGRRTRVCGGSKSFDDVFFASYEEDKIRKATPGQLHECLLAVETVSTDRRSGTINLYGNRYHDEIMFSHIGTKVMVRFDPDCLHKEIYVYRLDGSFIGTVACIEDAGFGDTKAARIHGRKRRQYIKHTKKQAELISDLTLDDLIKMQPDLEEEDAPEAKTIQLVNIGNTARIIEQETEGDREASETFLTNFGAGLKLVSDDDQL